MEKLSLRKFSDFQISKESLKVVAGGSDECTGGGFTNYYLKDGDSWVLDYTISWTSDTRDWTGRVTKIGNTMDLN